MSLYYILNDRFRTPMIEKQKAVGFARGLVKDPDKSLSASGGEDKGYSKKLCWQLYHIGSEPTAS